MITASNKDISFMSNKTICVYQWDAIQCGKHSGNYFVVSMNGELARMQGVKPGHMHIECLVDDMGNLVKATS